MIRRPVGTWHHREMIDPGDWAHMRRAVDLGKLSITNEPNRRSIAPKVGVVIVLDGAVIGESYRGETGAARHAEFGLLDRLDGDLSNATVYTTLEPCSRRDPPKFPCAQRLIDRNVKKVVIGIYDPNPKIYREGWRMLRDAGICLADFSPDLRAELVADNADFIGQFRRAVGQQGEAFFDYLQNGGHFTIGVGRCADFKTTWTACSETAIYALDYAHNVAFARYAKEFNEIDDPGALDFGKYTARVGIGEIVVFRNDDGYALVKVLEVMAEHDGQTGVRIAFELRTPVGEE